MEGIAGEIEGGGEVSGQSGQAPPGKWRPATQRWNGIDPNPANEEGQKGKRGWEEREEERAGGSKYFVEVLVVGLLVWLNDDTHILPITYGRSWEGEIAVSYTPPMPYAMLYYAML